jgi:hypothetical protein
MKEGEKEEDVDINIEMPPTSSKTYWIIAVSGRLTARSTVVRVKSTPRPTQGVAMRPPVKIPGTWKG